jgi:hypothetical protein
MSTVRRAAVAAATYATVRRLGRRSGVTQSELGRRLPGDELIPHPRHTIDRATTLPAPPQEVWPWIVQLGKERGGWYMPSWLEPLIVRRPETKAATAIEPEHQDLAEGDEVPDYGPGEPVFRVAHLEEPHALVYSSLRDPSDRWRWPEDDDPLPPGVFAFSWALVLDAAEGGRTRLHVRFRYTRNNTSHLTWLLGPLMGVVDYATIAVLFAGLRERTEDATKAPAPARAT